MPASGDEPTVISKQSAAAPPLPDGGGLPLELDKLGPGDRLGHFELAEFVGGGGMGRVFRAQDLQLSRPVAVKVLPRGQAGDTETLLRFRNEARSAARLDHENIARVYFVGEDRGLPYIVFEFVEGTNVRNLVEQRSRLPLAEALSYTIQVARALVHAAERNVVHRDIKPSNLLITPEGQVKLIDMGLARFQPIDESGADLTVSGMTLGTFDYISPEQARDPRVADSRSDIYSLGCTLFYMLTGRPPFPEGTVLQKLLQHQGEEPPEVRSYRTDLPEEVSRLLRRMLAKDPRRRFQAPQELVEHLTALADYLGLRSVAVEGRLWGPPGQSEARWWQSHLPWAVPTLVLLVIVGLLNALWSAQASQEDVLVLDVGTPEEIFSDLPLPGRAEPPIRDEGGAAAPAEGDAPPSPPPAATSEEAAEAAAPADEPPHTTEAHADAGASTEEEAPPADSDGEAAGENGPAAIEPPGESSPSPVAPAVVPADPAPSRSGVLVVGDEPADDEYPSLADAIRAASSGEVIELRFDGRREEPAPVSFGRGRFTVRSAEGYRPVLVFEPATDVANAGTMLATSATDLTLSNVHVELNLSRGLRGDRWSLVALGRGSKLRVEDSSMTIRNAGEQALAHHRDVAFVRVRSASRPEVSAAGGEAASGEDAAPAAPEPATIDIRLANCIARGEAVFLRVDELTPVDLNWSNGLLTTSERFLYAAGGPNAPQPDERIRIELAHLTAALRKGFCRFPNAPYHLHAEIECSDSVLLTGPSGALIEQEGAESAEDLRSRIAFRGDRNFYQGLDVFWSLRHADSPTPDEMRFEGWQSHWGERENLPHRDSVEWRRLPSSEQPCHTHMVADYELRAGDENPAFRSASSGRDDAGMRAAQLPTLPPALAGQQTSLSPYAYPTKPYGYGGSATPGTEPGDRFPNWTTPGEAREALTLPDDPPATP